MVYIMYRINDCDWFEIWYEDKQSMIATMVRNMVSDLECGYDYFGQCITRQRQMIEDYKKEFEEAMDSFKFMEDKQVNRWCYYDLKKRGAI